jgi:hypothetical protein
LLLALHLFHLRTAGFPLLSLFGRHAFKAFLHALLKVLLALVGRHLLNALTAFFAAFLALLGCSWCALCPGSRRYRGSNGQGEAGGFDAEW